MKRLLLTPQPGERNEWRERTFRIAHHIKSGIAQHGDPSLTVDIEFDDARISVTFSTEVVKQTDLHHLASALFREIEKEAAEQRKPKLVKALDAG